MTGRDLITLDARQMQKWGIHVAKTRKLLSSAVSVLKDDELMGRPHSIALAKTPRSPENMPLVRGSRRALQDAMRPENTDMAGSTSAIDNIFKQNLPCGIRFCVGQRIA